MIAISLLAHTNVSKRAMRGPSENVHLVSQEKPKDKLVQQNRNFGGLFPISTIKLKHAIDLREKGGEHLRICDSLRQDVLKSFVVCDGIHDRRSIVHLGLHFAWWFAGVLVAGMKAQSRAKKFPVEGRKEV